MNKNKSNHILFTILIIIILIITVFTVSYAAFYYSKIGEKINRINMGTITMSYSENSNGIYISDAYPTTDEVGKNLIDQSQYFDFTVSASMSGKTIVNYVIAASKIDEGNNKTLEDKGVKVYLTSVNDGRETQVVAPTLVSNLFKTDSISYAPDNQYLIYQGNFSKTESRNYRLRMWVADKYVLPADSLSYSLRINVYGNLDV